MLDFEESFVQLQERIQALRCSPKGSGVSIEGEIERLEKKASRMMGDVYGRLTPWQKVQVARHPQRPKTSQYISRLITQFTPLAGDRCFGEDKAILGGLGFFRHIPVMVMGHEKGSDVTSRITHNFGMAHPEGYRKAIRLMCMAQQFSLPVLFFIDTPGAYAGQGAEERGQAYAIAQCIQTSLDLTVPVLSVVIGEGGSGGAVAFGSGNFIAMLEHSVYSVISPEGCASILWHDGKKREEAAAAQKLTAQDLLKLNLIDLIIPEPLGGAQRNPIGAIDSVGNTLQEQLKKIHTQNFSGPGLRTHRREKFLAMGRKI